MRTLATSANGGGVEKKEIVAIQPHAVNWTDVALKEVASRSIEDIIDARAATVVALA